MPSILSKIRHRKTPSSSSTTSPTSPSRSSIFSRSTPNLGKSPGGAGTSPSSPKTPEVPRRMPGASLPAGAEGSPAPGGGRVLDYDGRNGAVNGSGAGRNGGPGVGEDEVVIIDKPLPRAAPGPPTGLESEPLSAKGEGRASRSGSSAGANGNGYGNGPNGASANRPAGTGAPAMSRRSLDGLVRSGGAGTRSEKREPADEFAGVFPRPPAREGSGDEGEGGWGVGSVGVGRGAGRGVGAGHQRVDSGQRGAGEIGVGRGGGVVDESVGRGGGASAGVNGTGGSRDPSASDHLPSSLAALSLNKPLPPAGSQQTAAPSAFSTSNLIPPTSSHTHAEPEYDPSINTRPGSSLSGTTASAYATAPSTPFVQDASLPPSRASTIRGGAGRGAGAGEAGLAGGLAADEYAGRGTGTGIVGSAGGLGASEHDRAHTQQDQTRSVGEGQVADSRQTSASGPPATTAAEASAALDAQRHSLITDIRSASQARTHSGGAPPTLSQEGHEVFRKAGMEDLVGTKGTVDVKTRWMKPIVQEHIRPKVHTEYTTVIERHNHSHHIHPKILPVADPSPTLLPPKHRIFSPLTNSWHELDEASARSVLGDDVFLHGEQERREVRRAALPGLGEMHEGEREKWREGEGGWEFIGGGEAARGSSDVGLRSTTGGGESYEYGGYGTQDLEGEEEGGDVEEDGFRWGKGRGKVWEREYRVGEEKTGWQEVVKGKLGLDRRGESGVGSGPGAGLFGHEGEDEEGEVQTVGVAL
ncbi:hypothetical protein IAT38_005915 [Cryptococcus sp. DSM 104549]